MEHRAIIVTPLGRVAVARPAFADLMHLHAVQDVTVGARGVVAGGVGGIDGIGGLGCVIDICHYEYEVTIDEGSMGQNLRFRRKAGKRRSIEYNVYDTY